MTAMNILMVYPENPETYWSFKHALKFISKKALNVPLGILTVSSLLPAEWKRKFIDMNVSDLKDEDIRWADYVFISAISIQVESVTQLVERCKRLNVPVVAGGPLFTEEHERFTEIDHFIMNEAEITLPRFIDDVKNGIPKRVYETNLFADITNTPLPDYSLLDMKHYGTACIQYSRGCPYDCEFCDITALFGRKVRTKTATQIIAELDQLYQIGWKGSVFIVDDNFIGHKKKLKEELLPVIIRWMKKHRYPFFFITEASINLADDKELMDMMIQAGFNKVFVGIETPEADSLMECNKIQNSNRNLMQAVKTLQNKGMEVTAGFIVGFDNDPPNIFQRQIEFIQKSGIITAMVGLLNAPRLSKLYKRLKAEGRIISNWTGSNTDYTINFIPRMKKEELIRGYEKIIQGIYSSKSYYKRIRDFLKEYNPPATLNDPMSVVKLVALVKSFFYLGLFARHRKYYWNLLFWSIFNKPKLFPMAVTYSIYGYHFRRVFKNIE
jgi:radical SAM superfamily enzyme YgiQ (UPF0313 family)